MHKEQALSYTEHVVQRGFYQISAREYPGEEPPILLMHGFPDNIGFAAGKSRKLEERIGQTGHSRLPNRSRHQFFGFLGEL